mmetsp:Transcript_12814/g.19158  ORF Transcript_12814/g.19158 Transcript_12814/m.19158 type:complete len:84 (-) Transcript_12814:3-254(-)
MQSLKRPGTTHQWWRRQCLKKISGVSWESGDDESNEDGHRLHHRYGGLQPPSLGSRLDPSRVEFGCYGAIGVMLCSVLFHHFD